MKPIIKNQKESAMFATRACLVLILLSLSGLASSLSRAATSPTPHYKATIRWTSYGIPHIQAADMGSAGYGFAWAVANDAVCVLAKEFVTVRGEQARYFGDTLRNVDSDVFYKALLNEAKLRAYRAANKGRIDALEAGYAAGYNRYLADHKGKMPSECHDAAWVKPINADDVARLDLGFAIRYGLGNFMAAIVGAAPGVGTSAAVVKMPEAGTIGSNAIGLGKSVTQSGRGILLGNPHYPWYGSSRFHVAQIDVPGQLDVFTASLIATTLEGISFNRDVAWSHTVSTAQRFTLFRLDLVPGDPMAYKIGQKTKRFIPIRVAVFVKGKDGGIRRLAQTVYMSEFGPVFASNKLRIAWNDTHAYVVRDVNYENNRGPAQYYDMDRAKNVEELKAALERYQGVAFVNTIAADKYGHVLYADIGAIPGVSKALMARCRVAPEEIDGYHLITLDGSKPDCNWQVSTAAAAPGVMAPAHEPSLIDTTYVENSNNSYWLSNPNHPLVGYSPIIGDEGTPRSLRTRAGLNFIAEVLARDKKFTPGRLEHLLTSNRNYGAEIFLDDILTICRHAKKTQDVTNACNILAKWDRRQGVDSVGAQIYQEFWTAVQGKIDPYFAVPFNPADPVHTPRGLKVDDPGAQRLVMDGLKTALRKLHDAGVPPDATWGHVQFAIRHGKKIPIPGGDGRAGMFSVIGAPLNPKEHGYNPIEFGNSYIQVVTWNADGTPDAHIMLTYSQSPEADSPHYADLTRRYSKSEWLKVPFTDKEIKANLVRTIELDSAAH